MRRQRWARWATWRQRRASAGDFLIEDLFTTSRSAGAVNGTRAEPGPGTRVAVDGNSKLTIAGGALSFATGGVGAGNPGLWYGTLTRTAGMIVMCRLTYTSGGAELGYDTNAAGQLTECIRFTGTTVQIRGNGISAVAVGAVATGTVYKLAVVARAAGDHFFIKGGAFTNWTLLYAYGSGALSVQPATGAIGTTSVFSVDWLRVPSTYWLPAPLASDGFSTWGTTDGLGHGETSGTGSGGNGEAWTNHVGTFGATGGVAGATALSGGSALATVDTSKADVLVAVNITHSGDNAGVILRYVDANNYVYAYITSTQATLRKVIGGVDSQVLAPTAITLVVGAEFSVSCSGTSFRLFYNHLAVGSAQTISDAGVASGTKQGLYTTNTGNTFDNFRVRARGTADEYDALTAYEYVAPPTSLAVSATTAESITVTWTDNSDNETGFQVWRSPNGSTGWTLITTAAANATTYENTGLSSATTYYYRVRAVNAYRESDYTSNVSGTTE